ncbi:Hypothetical predicted protein [Marmota monax]|uniref:Uncharacterized protein n=1 Tax=Marmota monax TaxID=9995 RepID=A0A5E4B009_MARMO|nr:Hypothetical predicted protein [Marmota monax]
MGSDLGGHAWKARRTCDGDQRRERGPGRGRTAPFPPIRLGAEEFESRIRRDLRSKGFRRCRSLYWWTTAVMRVPQVAHVSAPPGEEVDDVQPIEPG